MATNSPKDRLRYVSRDEMNLAEFPLTVLSTRAAPGLKTLEFSDTVRGKNGEVVDRQWIITGADKFGLPTASDDEVLLGLLKLTVDDGMRDRKVYFTRYELLRTLRWSTEGRSYLRLQKALDRLSGVRIKATNAFYDNDSKNHSTKNFGLIDAYEINTSRDLDLKTSFFIWSEVLFKSFQVGFIKKLDLDFYLGLKSAVSKRLYRYLDKHFWYKSRVAMNLFTLCHEKVGISRNYQYASSLRQQIDPAIEELTAAGFLASHEYAGKGKDTEIVLLAAKGPRAANTSATSPTSEANQEPDDPSDSANFHEALQTNTVRLLIDRGLTERQVLKLVAGKSEEVLRRIGEIVAYYDSLKASGSPLVSRSPVGFLYRAVENPQGFVLPGQKSSDARSSEPRSAEPKPLTTRQTHLPFPSEGLSRRGRTSKSEHVLQPFERKRRATELRQVTDRAVLSTIRSDVEHALAKLKDLISPQRFEEAIEHAVDEKLLKHFGFNE